VSQDYFPFLKILVTGSARLDIIRQSGDSLVGQFFRHRLLPFIMSELQNNLIGSDMNRFIQRGGFPESFFAEDEADAKRWSDQYIDELVRFDVLEIEKIYNLRKKQRS
jgi:predicted AAA+ superfamily ATPase